MNTTNSVREEFLRRFYHHLYGGVDEQPYEACSLSDLALKDFPAGRRVEITAQVSELDVLAIGSEGRPSYGGILIQEQSSIPFQRSRETVFSNIYRDPPRPWERMPFTKDQRYLELRALREGPGVVTVRGQLQQKEGRPLLLVERIVGFGEGYQRDAA